MFKFQLAEFSVQWDNMGVRVLKGLENVSSLYSAQKFKLKNSLLFCVDSIKFRIKQRKVYQFVPHSE